MTSKTSTRKRTRTESETEPSSPLSERDLPTSASSFLLKHTLALGIKFTPANDLYDVIPNVPIDESSAPFLLPQLSFDTLTATRRNFRNNSSLSGTDKNFIKKLSDVATNSTENIGTEESKTDSLVDDMLRSVGLNNWPLSIEYHNKNRNHPRLTVDIGGNWIAAVPEFVVRQCDYVTECVCIVAVDKHIKNVSGSSSFGESQISMEILSAAYGNFLEDIDTGNERNQTIYAIRVISNYVTFYCATVPIDYLKALALGIPKTETFEIIRYPGRNGKKTGLDLVDVEQRKAALRGMTILGLALA